MVAKKALKKTAPPPKKKAPAKEKASKEVKSAVKKDTKAKPVLTPKAGFRPTSKSKPAAPAQGVKPSGKDKAQASKAEIASNGPLGKKFTCYSCNTKFYDLNKPEKKCPKCGADQLAKPAIKSRLAALRQSEYEVEEEEEPVVEDDEILEEAEELEETEEEEVVAEEEE
jgi:uncharacterized protein (TIGR02300 family)